MTDKKLLEELSALVANNPEAAKTFLSEQGFSVEESQERSLAFGTSFWERKVEEVAEDLCGTVMNVYQDGKVIATGRFSEVLSWDSVPLEKGGDKNRFGELNQCIPGELFPYRMYGGFGFGVKAGNSDQDYGLIVVRGAYKLNGSSKQKDRLVSATKVLGHFGIDPNTKGEKLFIPERRLLIPPSDKIRSYVEMNDDPHKGKFLDFGVRGYKLSKIC